jgi:hypothetical protein
MLEHDPFDARLRDAFRRHVEAGPIEFDAAGFARTVAAAEPRRRARGLALPMRIGGAPQVTWILIVAALLTALVGSLLFFATQRHEERVPGAWQRITFPGAGAVNDVIETPTGFLAVGGDGTEIGWARVWISPDCVNWTLEPASDGFDGASLTAVARGGPGYVAVGESIRNAIPVFWTSPDGTSWTRVPDVQLLSGTGFAWADSVGDLETLDGLLVAEGRRMQPTMSTFWTSQDGATWGRAIDFDRFGLDPSAWGLRGVQAFTAGGPGLVAVGRGPEAGGMAWWSSDGRTWSGAEVVGPRVNDRILTDVAAGPGGMLAAIGSTDLGAGVWLSADGLTWSAVRDTNMFTSPQRAALVGSAGPSVTPAPTEDATVSYMRALAVAGTARGFMIVGDDGASRSSWSEPPRAHGIVWTSPDGRTWTREAPDSQFESASLSKVFPCDEKLLVISNPPAGVGAAWVRPIDSSAPPAPVAPSPTTSLTPTPPPNPSPMPTPVVAEGTDVLATTRARPAPTPATCPPGTDPSGPGPTDQARPPDAASQYTQPAMAFDRRAGKIILLAATRTASTSGVPSRTWAFDVCTNTWQRMEPVDEPPDVGPLAYDVDSDRTVALVSRRAGVETWVYDLAANRWIQEAYAPGTPSLAFPLIYDPVSGLLVGQVDSRDGYAGLWAYDVETNTWAKVQEGDVHPDWHAGGFAALGYDASIDRLVGWAEHPLGTWLFDPRAGAWEQVTTNDPAFGTECWGYPCPTFVGFDGATGMAEFASGFGGAMVRYDAKAHGWSTQYVGGNLRATGGLPYAACINNAAAYDALNRRVVCVSAYQEMHTWAGTIAGPTGMSTFDWRARQWSSLLDPIPAASATASPTSSP